MGIATDPGVWDYGPNCFACWGAGETPLALYAAVGGIMRGLAWRDWMPAPPNGLYLLPNIGNCQFIRYEGDTAQKYQPAIGQSQLTLEVDWAWYAFVGTNPQQCIHGFANNLQNIFDIYFGGYGIVFQLEPGSSAPSIADIMELINMQGRKSRKTEVFPVDKDHLVALFCDQVESTRIRIKYELQ